MSRNQLTLLGLLSGLIVLGADQASKAWILYGIDLPRVGQVVLAPVLNLSMVWNRGVTFGLLNGVGGWSYLGLAGLALIVVVALGIWLRRADSPVVAICLGSVAGGALGNVIDRLRFGAVVDFIDFHIGAWHWYVFNVADAAIVCGVVALVLQMQFAGRRAEAQRHEADNDGAGFRDQNGPV